MTEAAAPTPDQRWSRRRRYGVRTLLVVGTVLAVLAIFAVWANRQLLDANNWADTSTALLQKPAVRTQVAGELVDQLYANVNVTGELQSALPPRLRPLAAPAAGGLRNLAQQAAETALERPRVQEAWRAANRASAQQLIDIVEGNSKAITTSGNAVVLDLGSLLVNVATRLGLPQSAIAKIPPDAGQVKILASDDVSTVQDGAAALRGLAYILPFLSLLSFAAAVYLAVGRRRKTLLFVGIDLIAAGAIVLIARNVLGSYVVGALAKTESVRPAANAVWWTATGILHDVAQATIIMGIPVVFAAWLAGPTRPAIALRRAAAPWLRERPGVTYTVVGAVLALIVLWGPIPATRKVIPVLVMIGLVILGVEALRRQTAEEFPDLTAAAVGAGLRARVVRARAAVARDPATGNGAPPADPRLERLQQLSDLHDRGALSDDEYAAEKAAVLTR
jgi:Short C-terminal domain